MDIAKVIDKLREWVKKLIEVLVGPEAEPELELIPIPVRDRNIRR
jgi:hypothetical protein